MYKTLSPALLALMLAMPLSATAQSTEAPAEETVAEQPAAETPAEDAGQKEQVGGDLSLGEEAAPEPYVRETHGDWTLQCLRIPGQEDTSKEPCQMLQDLKDEQGAKVAEVTIFKLPSGGKAIAGANVLVPLETLLTAQLTIAIDSGKARRYPYTFCTPIGCFARVGFTAQDISALKRGAVAKLSLVHALEPDKRVNLAMSLTGFTAAYDAASVLAQ